jgi:cytochrome P450
MARRYGDPFRVAYLTGPVTFTGDPAALKALYTAPPDALVVWGVDVVEPVFGRTSVVVSSRERHRRDRKLLTPALHGNALSACGQMIATIAAEQSAAWRRDEPFPMLDTTQSITLDVMVRVVLGARDAASAHATRGAVLDLIDALRVPIFMFPALRRRFAGFGPWARYHRALTRLNQRLTSEIRRRRARGEAADDILGMMLAARYDDGAAMSEVEILDQLRALLFAGHEATATVLAWAMYWLHRHPEMLAKATAEIAALGADPGPMALAELPYLEAVCKETLRLNPPVVDSARLTTEPLALGPYVVPPGEAVRASAALLHAREELYPDADRFRPERFLERKFSPFEYIPFGGGARRCLGASFAMFEMKIILATILKTRSLRLVSAAPVRHERRRLTLGPRGGIPMVCT